MEKDGTFARPEPEDLSLNPEHLAFKEKYKIRLNAQLKEKFNIITIRLTDGRTDKLPLESVVHNNLIMLGKILSFGCDLFRAKE